MPTPNSRNLTVLGIHVSPTEERVLCALVAEKSIKGVMQITALNRSAACSHLRSLCHKHGVNTIMDVVNLYCCRVAVPVMEADLEDVE